MVPHYAACKGKVSTQQITGFTVTRSPLCLSHPYQWKTPFSCTSHTNSSKIAKSWTRGSKGGITFNCNLQRNGRCSIWKHIRNSPKEKRDFCCMEVFLIWWERHKADTGQSMSQSSCHGKKQPHEQLPTSTAAPHMLLDNEYKKSCKATHVSAKPMK